MTDQVIYKCPLCGFTSKSERGRNIHIGKMHKKWKLQQPPIPVIQPPVVNVNNIVIMIENLNVNN